jgi:hypothetical protein
MFGDARMIDGRIPRCADYVGAAALVVLLCDYQTAAQGGRRYGKCCVGRKEHSLARITPGMTSIWCMSQCS